MHPSRWRPARWFSALAALLCMGSAAPAAQADVGVKPGKIKHVWLIILENKSYDATFTGLNRNTYLWRALPAQGVLLKNYHGTGHGSLDNYTTLVSGQATEPDLQVDCPYYNKFAGHVDRTGSLRTNPNYGQMTSAKGPNAAPWSNGCVYPASVPTLFAQLDAAHVSWKGYAQDLANPTGGGPPHDAGVRYCGAPYRQPGRSGSTNQPNPSAATASSQYLPKHFPFPWFDSILRSGDCNARHIADLFSPRNGLYHDLQRERSTPAFSWITPDMCNDGHDAVCHGNNLSGGFRGPTRIRPPRNYTGGLYAADLFLRHIIPEIESSPAFKDGGLIDITFDESFPPFTFTANSFANSMIVTPDAATSIANDTAAETLFGRRVHYEPPGPNTPLAKDANGNALYPGPGNNLFLDRPSSCVQQTVPSQPRGTCLLGAAQHVPGPRTDLSATAPGGSPAIADNNAVITDEGRSVSGAGIPSGAFVGTVTNGFVPAHVPAQDGGFVDTGSFTLVDAGHHAVRTMGPVTGVTLGTRTPATDPLFDATHSTNGGGDTGSVLISPYIRPGSISTGFYNHYSWLRTIEDLFCVRRASRGLDGQGHLGYAAQRGLAPFGRDVFNRPQGRPTSGSSRYGGVPGWLRAATPRLARAPLASPGHPALAVEGDTVPAQLVSSVVHATAVGPTPNGTFSVVLTGGRHAVAIAPGGFTIVDEFGELHQTSAVGGAVPRILRPGQTLRLVLHARLPVGNGRLQWAPEGGRAIVAWDFELELK